MSPMERNRSARFQCFNSFKGFYQERIILVDLLHEFMMNMKPDGCKQIHKGQISTFLQATLEFCLFYWLDRTTTAKKKKTVLNVTEKKKRLKMDFSEAFRPLKHSPSQLFIKLRLL